MPLDLRQIGGDADADFRLAEGQPSHSLLDKIAEHLLRHHIIGNNAVLKRVNLLERSRGPAQEHAGVLSDCPDPVIRAVKRRDTRFLEDNAPSAHIDKHACRAKIDSDIGSCHSNSSLPAFLFQHFAFGLPVLTRSSGCPADFCSYRILRVPGRLLFFPHHDFPPRLLFSLLESTIRLMPETITRIQARSCETAMAVCANRSWSVRRPSIQARPAL